MTVPATDLSNDTLLDTLSSVDEVILGMIGDVLDYGSMEPGLEATRYASLRRGPLAEAAGERGLLWC